MPRTNLLAKRCAVAMLAMLVIFTPAVALDVKGNRLTLNAKEFAECEDGGGCIIISQRKMDKALRHAFEAGRKLGMREGTI